MLSVPMPTDVPATFRSAFRAVAYSRVSTEEQKKGFGIAVQARKNAGWIEKKNWNLVGCFSDEGVSGSLEIEDRPEGRKVMEMARRKAFDVLVVAKGDRIGRVGRAFWRWVWALEDMGIFVALVDKKIDNTTKEGREQMRRAADYAETEWETIRERTQGGLQEKAEDGGWTGGKPPFGWLIEFKGEKGLSRLMPNEDEIKIIRFVIKALRAGLGFREAARRLNAMGGEWLTRSGCPWSYSNLRDKFLSEPILKGYVTFRNTSGKTVLDRDGNPLHGETVRIPVPQFLSDADVLFLRSIADGDRMPKAKAAGYILSRRIIGLCGKHYTGRIAGSGSDVRTYRCHGKSEAFPGAEICDDHAIDALTIERHVWSEISKTLGDRARLEEIASEWLGLDRTDSSAHEDRIEALDGQIEGMKSAISAVIVASAKSGASGDAISDATSVLNGELAQLQQMRAEAVAWLNEKSLAEERSLSLLELAQASRSRLPLMESEERARFLALLDIRVYLDGPVPTRRGGHRCPVGAWYRQRGLLVPGALTDELWNRVEPLLSRPGPRGDVRRKSMEAILHKARTGLSWAVVAKEVEGSAHTAKESWARWEESGAWEAIDALMIGVARVDPHQDAPSLPAMRIVGVADPRLLVPEELSRSGSPLDSVGCGFAFDLRV